MWEWGWGGEGLAMLDWMPEEGLTKKMTCEKRPGGAEGTNYVEIWAKNYPARGHRLQGLENGSPPGLLEQGEEINEQGREKRSGGQG